MAAETIFIGCKMPGGVILDLDRFEQLNEQYGTVRTIRGKLPPVRLRGNVVRFGKAPIDIDGYVFTPVPVEFWEQWVAQNAESSLLADGFIKPAKTLDAGKGMAREHAAERGMSPPLIEGDERIRGIPVKKYEEDDKAA